jgi:LmbE family N-acetylglucosaminyl deacetylase
MGFWDGRRILVIAPHADDETLGCGGTMAKARAAGSQVFVLYASVGDVNHYRHGLVTRDDRLDDIRRATDCLGVSDFEVLYTDSDVHMRLDAVPQRELITKVETQARLSMDRLKPDTLLIPAESFNQDHRAVRRAVIAACRPHLPSEKPFVERVLTYEQPQLSWGGPPLAVSVYVDIADYIDTKLEAHACHRSQQQDPPHQSSLMNIRRIAQVRGSDVGVAAAEAFQCERLLT